MRRFFPAMLVFALVLGCKGPEGPAGPPGSSLEGDIIGIVALVNADGSQPSNRSGVTVGLEGLPLTTTTDSNGRFVLSNLNAGIFNINYSKPGYGSSKTVRYQFVGGGQAYVGNVTLCQPPSFSVSSISFGGISGAGTVSINVQLSESATEQRRVFLFFGENSSVSSNPQNYVGQISSTVTFSSGSGVGFLSQSTLRNAGIASGTTAYVVAYAANQGFLNSGYVDVNTGRFVYTNLSGSASNVISFAAP